MTRAKSGATQRTPAAESKRSGASAHSVHDEASHGVAPLATPHCACGGSCPRCRRAHSPIAPPFDAAHRRSEFDGKVSLLDGIALGDPHSALERDADRIARELVRGARKAAAPDKKARPSAAKSATKPSPKITATAHPAKTPKGPATKTASSSKGSGKAKPKSIVKPRLTPEEKADELEARPIITGPQLGERVDGKRPALRKLATPARRLTGGYMLPTALRSAFEAQLGIDLGAIRLHMGASAAATAAGVGARAFALGPDIVFGAGAYDPASTTGLELIAHEVAHVLQQSARPSSSTGLPPWLTNTVGAQPGLLIQRQFVVPARTARPDDPSPPTGQVPDDADVDRPIEWPVAGEKNYEWWTSLLIDDLHIMRDLDPEHQPRAWANHVLHAQQILRAHHVLPVEGARVGEDGILGPRTFLALRRVALDPNAPGRADIQGLGFNLDAIRDAERPAERARAYARLPEIVVQGPISVLGESAVRYYDRFFSTLYVDDRDRFDQLLFGGPAPPNIRRADRIELLRRLYGQNMQHLDGTIALVRVRREFIAPEIDVRHAVRHDPARNEAIYFQFTAASTEEAAALNQFFPAGVALDHAAERLSDARRADVNDTVAMLVGQTDGIAPDAHEGAAILLAIYLLPVDDATRTTVVDAYQAEHAQREREENERIDTHNREVAHVRADELARLVAADDMYHPERMARFHTALERNLGDGEFFDLVLDDLRARPDNMFSRLYGTLTGDMGDDNLGMLVELSLHGRYQHDPAVQSALRTLIDRHHAYRRHGYDVTGRGAILLDGSDRVEVGQVCGDINRMYKRSESREQLKPDSRRRLETALENEARNYMARLIAGNEPQAEQDDVGKTLLAAAWTAAGLTEDDDIEDVTWEESLKILGVRAAAASADGVPRYEVNYQVVQRVLGATGGDPQWVPVGDSSTATTPITPGAPPTQGGITGSPAQTVAGPALGDWHGESDFEYALFWYEYSQQAKVMIAMAKIVTIGAVIIVAWEAGVIAWLVGLGGGALPVGLSVGISIGIYMLTHHRWTLEGLLLAGFEGYLAAVGFKVFAPVGGVVGRFIIPATLEEVSFTRAAAAWLLRRAAVGGLTGGTVGPASLFVRDLVRMARVGGGFSPFMAYLQTAGMGALLGAVFEIGGSLLLAPVFEAANATVLRQLSEVITALRTREPPITTSQWFAEIGGALSRFRGFLGTMVDDAIARGIQEAVAERMAQVSTAYMNGLRSSIQREVLMLAEVELTRGATDGLERLLRLGPAAMTDDAMATLLQTARRSPNLVDSWLSFLNSAEDAGLTGLLARNQVRGLIDSPMVLRFGAQRGAPEMLRLMSSRFNNSLADLEAYARRVADLNEAAGNSVFDALRDRGTAVTARSLLRIAESNQPLNDEMLGGLQRLLAGGADAGRVDAALEAMTAEQVGPFLQRTHTANAADLAATRAMLARFEALEVAWAAPVPPVRGEALLGALDPAARVAIRNDLPPAVPGGRPTPRVTAEEAEQLVADLGINRVNRALVNGAPNGLNGSDLLQLRANLHLASVIDMLEWAAATPTRLGRIHAFAEHLDSAAARVAIGNPVHADSLIIDSNTMIGIEQLMLGTRFADLPVNRQFAINALRQGRGQPAYADPAAGARPSLPQIVGPGVDLRTSIAAASEIVRGEATTGRVSGMLTDFRRVGPARANPDYQNVVADLNTAPEVGGPKGGIDRSFIADAMFAQRAGAGHPAIVTADRDIVQRLVDARFLSGPRTFTANPREALWTQIINRFPEGRFTITIRGHSLDVIFGPPTGRAPVPP